MCTTNACKWIRNAFLKHRHLHWHLACLIHFFKLFLPNINMSTNSRDRRWLMPSVSGWKDSQQVPMWVELARSPPISGAKRNAAIKIEISWPRYFDLMFQVKVGSQAPTNYIVVQPLSGFIVDKAGIGCIRMPDPQNVGLAFGISFLSCLETEILVLRFCRHLINRP